MRYNRDMQWDIFGHDWAVRLLQIHAAGEKLRHAYLFVGPEGVGRRTLALLFAQALNCTQPPSPGEFCGVCRDCKQIQAMRYPDLSILVPEEGHQDVRIDQVRDLQHTLALAPYSAAFRIALLPNFQHVTIQAQNALLKTLEEPQDKVILLLTVDAIESLLPTIISRCEVIRLRPASIKETQRYLQTTKDIEEEKAVLIAHLSGGRIGMAIRMVDDPQVLASREEAIVNIFDLVTARIYERFKYAEGLTNPYDLARERVGAVLQIWLSFWRDVFIRTSGSTLPLVNMDIEAQVVQIASSLDANFVRGLVVAHERAIWELERNANVRLLLETLLLGWPRVEQTESL